MSAGRHRRGDVDARDHAGLPAHDRDALPSRRDAARRERRRHARRGSSAVSDVPGSGRARTRLAAGLTRLGVDAGDRVGTFCWNTQEHLEAYLAIPTMGAVLHTLNIRLFPEQLDLRRSSTPTDDVVIVDDSLIPLLAKIAGRPHTVEPVHRRR